MKRVSRVADDCRWNIALRCAAGVCDVEIDSICSFPAIAELLRRKQFSGRVALDYFLWPRLREISDPFLLPNMRAAVDRILAAIDRTERVVLFGDYDVDGITSLALLANVLAAYGASPALFLPLRIEEGYGLSRESVERCCATHDPQLLIAVDCGTASIDEIADLTNRGVDVIVLDHHEPKTALPDCCALINPKATGIRELDYFCTAGLAFKLAHALLKVRPLAGFDLREQLDLVALGTVADIVPLRAENRALVKRGLVQLAETKRPGLRRLMELAEVAAPIAADDVGFRLGPRLNAAGRLANAERALRLLLTKDIGEAAVLAAELDGRNRERQSVERTIVADAEERLAHEFDSECDAAIVLGSRGWHPGVLGIVASRISKKYCRPTIIIGFDDSGAGKGSGRSIEGLSLAEALGECSEFLEKFGGHEMAAGLTIREENLTAFSDCFRAAARARLTNDQLRRCIELDHEVTFAELNDEFLDWHQLLEPFGSGNRQPVFFARGVEPVVAPQVLKEKHIALRLRQRHQHRRAIYFDGASVELPQPPWDVAFQISSDFYEGTRRLGLRVQAIRPAQPD